MPWSSKAILNQLITMNTALGAALVQNARKGKPESLDRQREVWVGMGGSAYREEATGCTRRGKQFVLVYAYALGGDEGAGEDAAADWEDAIGRALIADRDLGGTCLSAELTDTLGAEAIYQFVTAEEVRALVLTLIAWQRETYSPQQ